jgi:DNA polymerase-3 subunit gamma/tau
MRQPSIQPPARAVAPEKKKQAEPEQLEPSPQPATSLVQATQPETAPNLELEPELNKPPQETNTSASVAHKKDVRKHWPEFVDYVRERIPWMGGTLQRASSARLEAGDLIIQYSDSADCRILEDRKKLVSLTEFAMDFFQKELRIVFKLPDAEGCDADPNSAAAVQKERQALANDPLVLAAVDIFNGQVGDIRVGPRFRKPLATEEGKKQEQKQERVDG